MRDTLRGRKVYVVTIIRLDVSHRLNEVAEQLYKTMAMGILYQYPGGDLRIPDDRGVC